MDDQDVIERLRTDLRAQSDETSAPDGLLPAGRRRAHQRQVRHRAGVGLAAAALVVVAVTVAVTGGDDQGSVDAGPAGPGPSTEAIATTTTSESSVWDDPPSQTPAEAARDGIIPEIAALPLGVRNVVSASVFVPEGEWAISEPTSDLIALGDPDTCLFGDLTGIPGVDSVCTAEYGEVVQLDSQGQLARAYPMTGVKPSWIHVTDVAVYGGRVGDGGQPHSSLFRIDRTTLELHGLLFPAPDGSVAVSGEDGFLGTTATSWSQAPAGTDIAELVHFGGEGTAVSSAIGGDLRVDLAGVEVLFGDR